MPSNKHTNEGLQRKEIVINSINIVKPIFVIGCAKSGTTLLNSLLSIHPSTGPKSYGMDIDPGQSLVDALLLERSFNKIAHTVERKSLWDEFFPVPAYVDLRTGAELTLYQSGLDEKEVHLLKSKLVDGLSQPRLLAKQPSNTFRIHVLRELFPDAKIVAIHRDGRDVVASWAIKPATVGKCWVDMSRR